MVVRTIKFRLYPNLKQKNLLEKTLEITRLAYNKQLELKIKSFQEEGINLTQFDLNNHLLNLKKNYEKFKNVHSQVLQNVNQRISWAFNNFYRRIRQGEKPGFPRFKGKSRYNSITYPQSGFSLSKKLYISKIGNVSIVKHRKLQGKIKTITIQKTRTNKWFVCLSIENDIIAVNRLRNQEARAGIDLGINNFYADSEGRIICNPRYLEKSEKRLARVHRNHSRKKKSSRNKCKSRIKIAKLYEMIRNKHMDFLHKESRKLASRYSQIGVEKLSIRNMIKNRYLSKSICSVSWKKFLHLLSYKVEETAGKLIEVTPHGTSQYCICGNKVKKSLKVRQHKCNQCGINVNRDVMSAMLIKKIAFEKYTVGSTEIHAWGNERLLSSMNQES